MGARRRGGSRVSCKDCGDPVLFQARGGKAVPRLHSDKQHDLCDRCWRKALRIGHERAAELGIATAGAAR